MKTEKIITHIKDIQKRITDIVTTRFKSYYLTGGTALNFYFDHRFSEDLDFFTQRYEKQGPINIMGYVSNKTGFRFKLEKEQDDPKLVSMKVYFMEIIKGEVLKIDFVQDFMKNIKRVKNGLHSIEDIYLRKISAAVGGEEKENVVGGRLPTGRQTVRDVYDIFYLSQKCSPLSEFFIKYFPRYKAEDLIAWYRSFNRMDLKMELLDLVPGVDTKKVLEYLDYEILKRLPDKLIP